MFTEWTINISVGLGSSGRALTEFSDLARRSADSSYEALASRAVRINNGGSKTAYDVDLIEHYTVSAKYISLFSALSQLSVLDESDPAAIDEDTHEKAEIVLSLLAAKAANPPKIFSHGGDAAVFSWTDFDGLKYITVSGGCAVFSKRDRGEKPVTIGVADMDELNSIELLPSFGVIRDSSSTNFIR